MWTARHMALRPVNLMFLASHITRKYGGAIVIFDIVFPEKSLNVENDDFPPPPNITEQRRCVNLYVALGYLANQT